MSLEVPLLTQDEFFRHLELRSVHTISVKFHYRQALKERLRASTKQDTHNVTQKVALKAARPKLAKPCHRNATNHILSYASHKWDASNASRRLFMGGRGGTAQSQSSSSLGGLTSRATETPSGFEPAVNAFSWLIRDDPEVYPIPKIRYEIQQRLTAEPEPEPKSDIVCRRNHLPIEEKPSPLTSHYTTHIRIQPPPKASPSNILVVPPEFAQALANRGESSRNCSIFKNHSILKPLLSVNSLLSLVKSSKSNQKEDPSDEKKSLSPTGFVPISPRPIRVSQPRPSPVFGCEKCQLKFHSRADLNVHEKSCFKFCRFCQAKLGLKRSQNTCRECLLRLKKRKIIPMILAQKRNLGSLPKCDICSKIFLKRTAMIKHVVARHASEMHKVDLVKFVSDTRDHSALTCRS